METVQKISLSAFLVFLMAYCYGQPVPTPVQESFAKKYAVATAVQWEQEEPNEWEADFKLEGKKGSASFDNLGNWLETEMVIKKTDVPAEVHKAINLKFDGWKIEEIESIEKPGFAGYEIVLEKEDTEVEVLVTSDGALTIEKVTVEEEDEHGDNGEKEEDHDN